MHSFLKLSIIVLGLLAFTSTSAFAAGKKYGLFVGINDYPGVRNDLSGAVNDAMDMKALLQARFGFKPANTALLTDSQATRANILAKLGFFGSRARRGDLLLFQYSGHGSLFQDKFSFVKDETKQVEVDIDLGNDERYVMPMDFYDSTIVPYDSSSAKSGMPWKNMILDDELYDLFAPIVNRGVTVVFISDSCHSGTISKGPDVKAKIRFMSPTTVFRIKDIADFKGKTPRNQRTSPRIKMNGTYIALSAARDNELAMDSDGKSLNGLFTAKVMEVIRKSTKPITYEELFADVEPMVSSVSLNEMGNNQNPQLVTSSPGGRALRLFAIATRK